MVKIRSMVEADQNAVEHLATSTGLFPEGDWRRPNLNELSNDHRWIVAVSDSELIVGAAYFAPEPVSDSLWNIFFLAVNKVSQGEGIGGEIMAYIEDLARKENIRTLLVETSSLESYAQARGFYQSLGYVKEAEIRDYYGSGDNKVVFWKSLSTV